MAFLKVLFLILLAIPFFLFLLYIIDKLMDELPKRSTMNEEDIKAKGPQYSLEKREHHKSGPSKRQRRKARKQKKQ